MVTAYASRTFFKNSKRSTLKNKLKIISLKTKLLQEKILNLYRSASYSPILL